MGTHPPGVMTMCTTGTGLAAVEHAVVVHAEQLSRSQQEPWGTLWLTESVLRAVLVLHLAISQAVLIGQPPGIIAIAAGIVFTPATSTNTAPLPRPTLPRPRRSTRRLTDLTA